MKEWKFGFLNFWTFVILRFSNFEKIKDFEQILSDLRHDENLEETSEKISSDDQNKIEKELKKLGYI